MSIKHLVVNPPDALGNSLVTWDICERMHPDGPGTVRHNKTTISFRALLAGDLAGYDDNGSYTTPVVVTQLAIAAAHELRRAHELTPVVDKPLDKPHATNPLDEAREVIKLYTQPDGQLIDKPATRLARALLAAQPVGANLPEPPQTRDLAIKIAQQAAAKSKPSYWAADFQPHAWVVDAVVTAMLVTHEASKRDDKQSNTMLSARMATTDLRGFSIDGMPVQAPNLKAEPIHGIPMRLHCPQCHYLHIDTGEFETKPHHTHACQVCGLVWRPALVATVGVQFLPGFKNDAG